MKNIRKQMMLVILTMFANSLCEAVEVSVTGASDPTKPPPEVIARMGDIDKSSSGNIVLNGVKQDGKTSLAILNGNLVKLGEVYQGYRLISVKDSHVVLEDESHQKLTLSMNIVGFKKQEKQVKKVYPKSSKAVNTKSVHKTN
jgi:hypothetical protein